MVENWELRVWSPIGAGPRIISRDASHIPRTGIRAQLTPEGDCREMTFDAKGNGLGLKPLDCVQLVYGGTPLFYGEVRVGGNTRDVNGHRHVLRSLAGRLGDVALSETFTTPQQPAHLTVQAIMQDVLPALGGTVLFNPARCPDLGFDLAPVQASNFQNPKALLEKIVEAGKSFGVTVVYGVGPDRTFFCRAASTDQRQIGRDELTGATQWKEPVAEVVVTAVRWLLDRYTAQPERWLSHVSRAPEAALYGERVKTVAWATGTEGQPQLWAPVPLTYTVDPESTFVAYSTEKNENGRAVTSTTDPQLAASLLTDGKDNEIAWIVMRRHTMVFEDRSLTPEDYNKATGDMVITARAPAGQRFERVVFSLAGKWERQIPSNMGPGWYKLEQLPVRVNITSGDHVTSRQITALYSPVDASGRSDINSSTGMEISIAAGETVEIRVPLKTKPSPDYELILYLHELRAERFKRNLLDQLAHYHYRTPAQEPADIELRTFLPPSGLPKYITLGDYQSIVDAWEYRLSADRGLLLGCLTGQAEDPESLAQAELIKARDGQAVITAITAGGR